MFSFGRINLFFENTGAKVVLANPNGISPIEMTKHQCYDTLALYKRGVSWIQREGLQETKKPFSILAIWLRSRGWEFRKKEFCGF